MTDSGIQKQKLGPRQQAWVDALRSGKYKQGKSKLRSEEDRFCCLGVACDICPDVSWSKIGTYFTCDGEYLYAPNKVMRYFGLDSSDGGIFLASGPDSSLASRNDNGCTFRKIADFIENYPEKIFRGPV